MAKRRGPKIATTLSFSKTREAGISPSIMRQNGQDESLSHVDGALVRWDLIMKEVIEQSESDLVRTVRAYFGPGWMTKRTQPLQTVTSRRPRAMKLHFPFISSSKFNRGHSGSLSELVNSLLACSKLQLTPFLHEDGRRTATHLIQRRLGIDLSLWVQNDCGSRS